MAKLTKGKLYLPLLLLIFFALLFCLSGCGGSKDTAATTPTTPTTPETPTTPTTPTTPETPDLSSLTLSTAFNFVTYGTPLAATATLIDASGAPVAGAVVTFAASSGLVVFAPVSATALTDGTGTASLFLNTADPSSAGATSITASAPLTSGGTTSTITSPPVGISVGGALVTLGDLTFPVGLPTITISAYGTTSVSAPVLIGGLPATIPVPVAFSSDCVGLGKATLTTPVTSNPGTGIATSTYKDNGCGTGTDHITAAVTGHTASAVITVTIPAPNNMQFVSATPAIIGTLGTTLPQSSLVKFQVVDSSNNGVPGVLVRFSLVPPTAPGGITLSPAFPVLATSDANGFVTASVGSGTVPTSVWVQAALDSNPAIVSQSNRLTITTALPTQNFFSLSVSTHNIEGWNYDGTTSTVTVIASDRLGNPVPDGTVINFITEGAQFVPASCTTTSGTCTVNFRSSAYRPIDERTTANPNGAVAALYSDGVTPITIDHDLTIGPPLFVKNGRVTILAYALGEKSFVDSNGNNTYDPGTETFYDLGDLFLDSNENGIWDSSPIQPDLLEQFIHYTAGAAACVTHIGGGGTTSLPADYATSPSKQNTCNGVWGLNYVRREDVIVLSSSHPLISQDTFRISNCLQTFSFWLMDENHNPMPAGTTLALANSTISFQPTGATAATLATVSVGGAPVVDTTHAGGTGVTLRVDGGATCKGALTDPIPFPVGSVQIVTTTLKGLSTPIGVSVCNPAIAYPAGGSCPP